MILFLSIMACATGMIGSWYYSRGTLSVAYRLGIVTGLCYVALNLIVAYRGQAGVLFLVIPSAWAVFTSALGLRRLGR